MTGFNAIQPLFPCKSRVMSGQVIDYCYVGCVSPQTLSVFETMVQLSHSPVPVQNNNLLSQYST
jgi:hypothetical protein